MAQQHGIGLVLLGHHRRDQAETFLLQALRGAGVDGLSAMPGLIVREGISWARPWLESPREAIDAYVRTHRLSHIEDASNDDPRFDRNRLRASVWPSLVQAFPGAEASLADAARRAQDGAAGLAEWSRVDLASVCEGEELDVGRWRSLPPVRRSNVLRAWLRARYGRAPPATLSKRLLDELGRAASGRWPAPPGELQFHRGRLRYETSPVDQVPPPGATSSIAIDLDREGEHPVDAWCGTFVVRRVDSGGVPATVARSLELRARRAGDRFQAGAGRPPRGLKLQFQAAGVPPWQRSGPIATSVDEIVYVPGLGLDARAVAIPGSPRVVIDWRPDRPGADVDEDPAVRR